MDKCFKKVYNGSPIYMVSADDNVHNLGEEGPSITLSELSEFHEVLSCLFVKLHGLKLIL